MSIGGLEPFFGNEPKSIIRGENQYNSKHVASFEYAVGVMRVTVYVSMNSRTYKSTVSVKEVMIDSRHHDTVAIMLKHNFLKFLINFLIYYVFYI